jgi:hypothetical protein
LAVGFVASSADGTKLVATTYDPIAASSIYTSPNSGATWVQTRAPFAYWGALASSADGTKLVALIQGGSTYTSTDSGATWAQTSAPCPGWCPSVTCSADGNKLAAAEYGGSIYTSTNFGATWIKTSAPLHTWISIASSTDGTKLVAVADDSASYSSTNSGAIWTPVNAPGVGWEAVASFADGSKVVAVGISLGNNPSGGPIYALQLPIPPSPPSPTPLLNMNRLSGNLSVSWLVPSSSFVLQENSDLVSPNWTDLPGSPTLNLSSLHLEVPASPSIGSHFYRLQQR